MVEKEFRREEMYNNIVVYCTTIDHGPRNHIYICMYTDSYRYQESTDLTTIFKPELPGITINIMEGGAPIQRKNV